MLENYVGISHHLNADCDRFELREGRKNDERSISTDLLFRCKAIFRARDREILGERKTVSLQRRVVGWMDVFRKESATVYADWVLLIFRLKDEVLTPSIRRAREIYLDLG